MSEIASSHVQHACGTMGRVALYTLRPRTKFTYSIDNIVLLRLNAILKFLYPNDRVSRRRWDWTSNCINIHNMKENHSQA